MFKTRKSVFKTAHYRFAFKRLSARRRRAFWCVQLNFDWFSIVLLLRECHAWSVNENDNTCTCMSTEQNRSVLSIKDKQIVISCLDKRPKVTNLAFEFGINKQQDSNRSPLYMYKRTTISRDMKDWSKSRWSLQMTSIWIRSCLFSRGQLKHQFQAQLLQEKAKHLSLQLHVNGE